MKYEISLYFIIQEFCVVETALLAGWHIQNWSAITYWYHKVEIWTGTVFLFFCIIMIIVTEVKMRRIKNEQEEKKEN